MVCDHWNPSKHWFAGIWYLSQQYLSSNAFSYKYYAPWCDFHTQERYLKGDYYEKTISIIIRAVYFNHSYS